VTTTPFARRALLFSPGDDLKKIGKGAALGADGLILDMEDGVALSRKAEARQSIANALNSIDFGRTERLVRINPLETGFGEADLQALLADSVTPPDAVVVPKLEAADQVRVISQFISEHEQARGLPTGAIRLLVFIETARGMINLSEIAASDSRLDALLFGAEDLAGNIGATRTKSGWEIFHARSQLVLAAAANHLQAIDTIFADLHDLDGLTDDAEFAMRMGYVGKLAIHPRQVEPITAAFTPADEAIEAAAKLAEAFAAHQQSGAGVFAYEGKMIDMPMLRAAENLLARARAAGKL
jgi:citrate lyase beta subunit